MGPSVDRSTELPAGSRPRVRSGETEMREMVILCPGSSQTSGRSGDQVGLCTQPLEGPLGTAGGSFLAWVAAAKIYKNFFGCSGSYLL